MQYCNFAKSPIFKFWEVVIILARVLKGVVEMTANAELLPRWKEIMEQYYQELTV